MGGLLEAPNFLFKAKKHMPYALRIMESQVTGGLEIPEPCYTGQLYRFKSLIGGSTVS